MYVLHSVCRWLDHAGIAEEELQNVGGVEWISVCMKFSVDNLKIRALAYYKMLWIRLKD